MACLSCPSEHSTGPGRDLEGPVPGGRGGCLPPLLVRKEGRGRGRPLKVCRPSHSGALGTRGGGCKLCANILPSPQDIFCNKRPWKCQLV